LGNQVNSVSCGSEAVGRVNFITPDKRFVRIATKRPGIRQLFGGLPRRMLKAAVRYAHSETLVVTASQFVSDCMSACRHWRDRHTKNGGRCLGQYG